MELVSSVVRRRLRHAPALILQEAHRLMEEFRLFARIGNGDCVFRQTSVEGMSALVRADEEVGRCMYFYGEFEVQDSRFLFDNVHESDICVDIGANVGFYTLGFARRARLGAVHSFEPVPLNYHVLAVNVIVNRFSHVVVNNCAVGATDGEVNFCIAEDGAYSSLVDTGRKAIVSTSKTRIVTLDSYCREHNLPRVDVLKVDVEGAEALVLRGSTNLFADSTRRPRLVMLELVASMLQLYGSTREQIEDKMKSFGYSAYVTSDSHLVPFSERTHAGVENIVFLDSRRSATKELREIQREVVTVR